MKTILPVLAAVLLSGSTIAANNTSPAIDPQPFITRQPGDTVIVPQLIRDAFAAKYPQASRVSWYRYSPDLSTPEPGVWYASLDTSDYYVSFYWNDADHIAWYDNGSWIRTSTRIDNTELPDAVARVISSQYPGYVITDVDLENDKNQVLYEVDLVKGNQKWNLHLNPSGAIIKKKSRTLTTADASTEMVSDFESRYPNASAVTWYRYYPEDRVDVLPSDWNYSMDANDYEVRFRSDGADYVAYYDNGRWVRSETLTFDRASLPASVNQAISRDFAGYSVKEVDREDNPDRILYEVELQKGADKCKIHYTAEGSVVKKKCKENGVKTKQKSSK